MHQLNKLLHKLIAQPMYQLHKELEFLHQILMPHNLQRYNGPDIPCFLNIEKWIRIKIRVTSGKTNV